MAVIAFHAATGGGPPLWGGFVGVDVFFVLSGFLITSLLLDELAQNGHVRFRDFYARRALRLLPALVLLLVVMGLVVWALERPLERPYWRSALLASTYVGNWFDPFTNLGPLVHTWSLAIEEQYYLLWPAVLVLASRVVRSHRSLAIGIAVCGIGSAMLRAFAFHTGHNEIANFSTVTRADGILIGSALALAMPYLSDRTRRIVARRAVGLLAAGVILAAFAVLEPDGDLTFNGGILLVVVASATLIAHLAFNRSSPCRRWLSLQPLPAIGRISYGLYLFHPAMAVLVFGNAGRRGTGLALMMVVLSFVVAVASFVLVERPALILKARFASTRRRPAEAGRSDSTPLGVTSDRS